MGLFSDKEEKPSKKMEEMDDSDRLDQGQYKVRIVIELLGQPKDLMQKTFDMLMTQLKTDTHHYLLSDKRAPFKAQGKLWSTFTEAELWVKDFRALAALLFEYLPSSVEIAQPSSVNLKAPQITNFLNDLQTRLHEQDMKVKNLAAEVQVLKKQGGGMLFNLIVLSLKEAPKNIEELAKSIGATTKDLKPYLKKLTETKSLKKEGDTYSLGRK